MAAVIPDFEIEDIYGVLLKQNFNKERCPLPRFYFE